MHRDIYFCNLLNLLQKRKKICVHDSSKKSKVRDKSQANRKGFIMFMLHFKFITNGEWHDVCSHSSHPMVPSCLPSKRGPNIN